MRSRRYLVKKFLQALLTLVFVLSFNFFLFRIMPSDPARFLARSGRLSAQQAARLEHELGLDKALPQQFVIYVKDTLSGNLGLSFIDGAPVTEVLAKNLKRTLLLVGVSTILSTVFGLLIGIYGAWRRGSTFDVGSLGASLVLYSMPEFWLGMMLLIVFGYKLHLFPLAGYQSDVPVTGLAHVTDLVNHMFLPALTLTLAFLGEYALIIRASLLDVMGEEYVTTARAKGLMDAQVLWRHSVPNALLPAVTLVVLNLAFVVGGAITVETVFSYQGLGLLTYEAINNQDYPILQGIFLLFSGVVIVANLVADVLYGYLDPRVREA